MRPFNISPTDKSFIPALQDKIDNLNKPKGSLGRLESLALQIGLVQHSLTPCLTHPCHILLGADHGIEREGVSVSPREVTWQQMENFCRGGGGVNMFCRQHGFRLFIVDMGVDHDFSPELPIINRKIAYGTRNFLHEPAMSEEEMLRAIDTGAEMVDRCCEEGSNIVCFGEMGIANTSPSSIWMSLFEDIPLQQCIGAGAGLDNEGQRHKYDILRKAVDNFTLTTGIQPKSIKRNPDTKAVINPYTQKETEAILRWFGGFEMLAATGGMLRAAEKGILFLVDGFIMTASALAAICLNPNMKDYAVFTHCGDESGHRMMLDGMGADPLLSLGLRLGEGTGALCAYPILVSAVNMVNELDNFQHAHITKYF